MTLVPQVDRGFAPVRADRFAPTDRADHDLEVMIDGF